MPSGQKAHAREHLVQIFKKGTTPPKAWRMSDVDDILSGISAPETVDLVQSYKPLNPFDRLSTQSVRFYLVLIVMSACNSSIFMGSEYPELPELSSSQSQERMKSSYSWNQMHSPSSLAIPQNQSHSSFTSAHSRLKSGIFCSPAFFCSS